MARHQGPVLLDEPHPTRSISRRFPEDQELRAAGFAIHARPRGREAVWLRQGVLYCHSEALRIARGGRT